MSDTRQKWSPRDISETKRKVRVMIGVLESLLAPSEVPRRGTVLDDLFYRAQEPSTPDGMPRSSIAAAPALAKQRTCGDCKGEGADSSGRWCEKCRGTGSVYIDLPASDGALRTHPDDPLRRKLGHGYAEDSSVESAVEDSMDDICERCAGTGNLSRGEGEDTRIITCDRCAGSGRRWADPVAEAVEDLYTRLIEMTGHAVVIHKRHQAVIGAAGTRGKSDVEYCEGCHRARGDVGKDPFRRGHCSSCSTSWYDWRKEPGNDTGDESADRMRFNGQHKRYDGHNSAACEPCAELRLKADDSWRAELIPSMQANGTLPARRR